MPIVKTSAVPGSPEQLDVTQGSRTFVIFISSEDPQTRQPWCPDVRAAWPHITAAFGGDDAPELSVIEVGQRPEWKDPDNVYRKIWNVHGIPTLARFKRVNGKVTEAARLDENGITNKKILQEFIRASGSE